MNGYQHVICFCPAGRFFLVSLTLSTWTTVERFVLTEDPAHALRGFDAAIVMDRFVTADLVERLASLPTIVLAWNGLFEIERYRKDLPDGVTYMGTDSTAPTSFGTLSYLPTINSRCSFLEWQSLYRGKRQFVVEGNAAYKLRWLRTRMYENRALCIALSSAAAVVKRPRTVAATVQSAFLTNKLAWAGNCYYDLDPLALSSEQLQSIGTSVSTMQHSSTALDHLHNGLALLERWRATKNTLDPARTHEGVYVTNTLLRWTVLSYLRAADASATWFFGSDNVGLGLAYELDVYSLVSNRRVAFVDFGGKTSETTLYPRSLQLLARECYVIAISASDSEAVTCTVERIHAMLTGERDQFFATLEARRRALYNIAPDCELGEAQRRVWNDFSQLQG